MIKIKKKNFIKCSPCNPAQMLRPGLQRRWPSKTVPFLDVCCWRLQKLQIASVLLWQWLDCSALTSGLAHRLGKSDILPSMEEQPKERAQDRQHQHHGEDRTSTPHTTSLKHDQSHFQRQHQETQTKKTGWAIRKRELAPASLTQLMSTNRVANLCSLTCVHSTVIVSLCPLGE